MSEIEAVVFVEVDITVVGTLLRAGQDDCMEDVWITDIRRGDLSASWFEGVDMKSPDVQRLLTNMLQTIADEAHEELLEAAASNEGLVMGEVVELRGLEPLIARLGSRGLGLELGPGPRPRPSYHATIRVLHAQTDQARLSLPRRRRDPPRSPSTTPRVWPSRPTSPASRPCHDQAVTQLDERLAHQYAV